MSQPKVSLLLTGNEILLGDIADTNSLYMAKELRKIGINILQKRVVGDHLETIVNALISLSQENDVLIVNGGLGSTVDDLGTQAASQASGQPLVENPIALAHLTQVYHGKKILPGSLPYRQVMLPEQAQVLPNPVGTAVGFMVRIGDCFCYFTPGVPREMKAMLVESILPGLCQKFPLEFAPLTERFLLMGIGEVEVQERLKAHFPQELWEQLELGFRAISPLCELKFSISHKAQEPFLIDTVKQVQTLLGPYIVSQDQNLAQTLLQLLKSQGKTLAIAESCTGGLIASQITSIAGASESFHAGMVTYSNQAKMDLLEVPPQLLERDGAVSASVAQAMVRGALKNGRADYAISVTGIAGPGGGSEEKPVGTVYIAYGSENRIQSRRFCIPKERKVFQQYVTATALDLLRRFILGLPTEQRYYFDTWNDK